MTCLNIYVRYFYNCVMSVKEKIILTPEFTLLLTLLLHFKECIIVRCVHGEMRESAAGVLPEALIFVSLQHNTAKQQPYFLLYNSSFSLLWSFFIFMHFVSLHPKHGPKVTDEYEEKAIQDWGKSFCFHFVSLHSVFSLNPIL